MRSVLLNKKAPPKGGALTVEIYLVEFKSFFFSLSDLTV